jgi:trimeric autotransporter adhesin
MSTFAWIARLGTTLTVVAALGGGAPPALSQRVGVNSAVNPNANGTPPSGAVRRLVIGQEIVHDEQISTGGGGQTQILFLDESAMTVGPNSDVTIDNFVYDPNTGKGQLAMSATKGVMRFVGGKLSKNEDSVSLRTPSAVIGIRGGVFLANVAASGQTEVTFLYGKGLMVTANNVTQTITRPGFAVSVSQGSAPSAPAPAPPSSVASTLGEFSGQKGTTGGSSKPPTEANIATSGISNVVSGNVAASVQQATQNLPATTQPTTVNVASIQSNLNINTIASQAAAPIVQADLNPKAATPSGPVVISISGVVKDAAPGSGLGFINQSARIPYTGTITFPVGSGLQNGTATGFATSGSVFTLSPLTAGATTNVTGIASTSKNPATGTAFLSADGNFFFANLTAQGAAGDQVFVFGGAPVQQSFFTATNPNTQLLAFNVLPDFTLGSGSQSQTIPFLPAFAGGTSANAVVSPLYLAIQPNSPFGSFNPNTNPSGLGAPFLQASLAISGQGANQSSALSILTGDFFTSSDTGLVAASGPIRGTFLASGTSPLTHIASGFATVPDANGNNLFGGSSIDGFVLDSNQYNQNLNFVQSNAQAFTIGNGSTTTNFAFNQPVVSQALTAGVGSMRPALSEQGFFGGIMTNGSGFQYVLTGSVALGTNPGNNSLFAEFGGADPFTPNQSGVGALVLPFGTISGRNYARSTFIDSNIFAATESATVPVVIATPSGSTTSYPTFASGASIFPSLGLVTSASVPGAANGLLPAGASFCACQYLQWGYWEANIPAANNGGPTNTVQSSFINTWLAGTPTVNLPTSGTASYNGAAIGTVSNNGANYLAAGAFNNTYNFGSNTGTITISNFDNKNFTSAISGGGGVYAGTLNGSGAASNITGTAVGQFFGPGAVETGGAFNLHAISGPNYLASGIFAGR